MRRHAPGRTFYSLPESEPTPQGIFTIPPEALQRFVEEYNRLTQEAILRAIHPAYSDILLPPNFGRLPDGFEGETRVFSHAVVDADTAKTLVDLARAGDETTFRDLAACCGVPATDLDDLWRGTRVRLFPAENART